MKAKLIALIIMSYCVSIGSADTFRNRETGEEFYGFRTQKQGQGKVIVYHTEEKKMIPIEESKYEITLDSLGRRNSIIRIQIVHPDVLLSKVVSERIAQSIIEASNSGPQFIVIEIDSPGGRGEYMRIIASAIEQTTNAPVVAYIPGGVHAGAYSSAAVIAMACDAIYMASSASIGAVGPMTGGVSNDLYSAFIKIYSPDTLGTYSNYAMGLAPKRELQLMARAMVDKSVSIVEVVDATDNLTKFVERDNRQPTQTIVRTIAEGVSPEAYHRAGDEQGLLPTDVVGRVLSLTAEEAVRIGLADQIVSSIAEIAKTRDIRDAQIVNAPDINSTIRRFEAGRRSIAQGLVTIERLEEQALTLEEQVAYVENQLRTGTVTHEVSRIAPQRRTLQRRQVILPDNIEDYYAFNLDQVADRRNRTTSRSRRQTIESERFVTDQPIASLQELRNEQTMVLNNLIAEYRRVSNLARRWPGGLPPELPVQTLESNMNSAVDLLDSIRRMPVQF